MHKGVNITMFVFLSVFMTALFVGLAVIATSSFSELLIPATTVGAAAGNSVEQDAKQGLLLFFVLFVFIMGVLAYIYTRQHWKGGHHLH